MRNKILMEHDKKNLYDMKNSKINYFKNQKIFFDRNFNKNPSKRSKVLRVQKSSETSKVINEQKISSIIETTESNKKILELKKRNMTLSFIVPYEAFTDIYFSNNFDKVEKFVKNVVLYLQIYYNIFNITPIIGITKIFDQLDEDMAFNKKTHPEIVIEIAKQYRLELMRLNQSFDVSIFLSPYEHIDSTGFAFEDMICEPDYSIVVAKIVDPIFIVSTIAHEIGHLFKVPHIEKRNATHGCKCQGVCLMHSVVQRIDFKKIFWSNCDIEDIFKILKNEMKCLGDQTNQFLAPYCGDGKTDTDEECDCGTLKECIKNKSDKCCHPSECIFKNNSDCFDGNCCVDCLKLKYSNSCQSEFNECSSGYCSADSQYCKSNLKKWDLDMTCNNGKDRCFKDKCVEYSSLCKNTYGQDFENADSDCFEKFNTVGNQFGFCHSNSSKYLPCSKEDARCGKLICKISKKIKIEYLHQTQGNCISIIDLKTDRFRSLTVRNGTPCGENKICYKNKCVLAKEVLKIENKIGCGYYGLYTFSMSCICDKIARLEYDGLCYLQEYPKSIRKVMIFCLILIHLYFSIQILKNSRF